MTPLGLVTPHLEHGRSDPALAISAIPLYPSDAPMQRLDAGKEITLELDGETLPAREGEPVAAALLAAGERVFSRSVKYHRPRGPFCFAAACSQCLMRIDGVPNLYTCRTPARAGMRLERQNAYPSAKFDVFAATDWMFPRGLDHHEMFAGVPIAEQVMAKVARHLAGLGTLPDRPADDPLAAESIEVPVLIVGGGASGLAAAQIFAARGVPFLLIEREPFLGGRLAIAAPEENDPAIPDRSALPLGSVRTAATAIGLYDDEAGRFVAARQGPPEQLIKIYPRVTLLAMGGHPQLIAFENNDLPGVIAGRALSALIRKWQMVPRGKVAVVGAGRGLEATARLLQGSGAEVAAIIDRQGAANGALQGEPIKAHGRGRVIGLTIQRPDGVRTRLDCQTIAVCAPPAPSFELARQGGARIRFDQTSRLFVVEADQAGRTAQPDLFIAGDLSGPIDATASAASGRRAAEAICSELGTAR